MIGALETATVWHLTNSEPLVSTQASRISQRREIFLRQLPSHFTSTNVASSALESPTVCNEQLVEESTRSKADNSIAQLIYMQSFEANWDGLKAAAPNQQSIHDARRFIRALAPESIIPVPTLHADGHAVLLYRSGNTYAELEFLGSGNIGFFARRDGEEWGDEFSFDGSTIPLELQKIGFVLEPYHELAVA